MNFDIIEGLSDLDIKMLYDDIFNEQTDLLSSCNVVCGNGIDTGNKCPSFAPCTDDVHCTANPIIAFSNII